MKSLKLRENIVLLGTVLFCLLPLTWLGSYVVHKHQWAQTRLAELEPRYARMQGLDQQRAELQAALLQAQTARAQYVYPAEQDATQAGNAAQERIRNIFSSAGLQIISSQVLPAKEDKGFDRIPLTVRAEGELLALQSALAVLSSQMPVIVINEVEVQVRSAPPNAEPYLATLFNLSVLRERT